MIKLIKYRYLLLFVLFIIIAFGIKKSEFGLKTNTINTELITKNIFTKEAKADNCIDSLLINTSKNQLAKWVNTNAKDIDLLYNDYGISLYVYYKSKLVYWTTNAIAIEGNKIWTSDKFTKLDNAFVEVRQKNNDSILIVGTINVKNNFPYENKFLDNTFHHSFNLDSSYELLINSDNTNNSIHNKEGDYLFSLTRKYVDNSLFVARLLSIIILIAIIFLIIYTHIRVKNRRVSIGEFSIISTFLIAIRVVLQITDTPLFLNKLPIFQSQHFTCTQYFPSLGDLLVTVSLIVYLIFILYIKVDIARLKKYSLKKSYLILFVWLTVFIVYATIAQNIFTHLIQNSNFEYEAYNVLSLTIFSFIGYYILLLMLIGLILLIDKAGIQIKGFIKFKNVAFGIVGTLSILLLLNITLQNYNSILPIIFLFAIITYWSYARLVQSPKYINIVMLIILFSAYTTYFIRKENFKIKINESKAIALSIAEEKDPIAESIIGEIINTVKTDTIILNHLNNSWFNYDKMVNYIQQKYFTGYMNRYDFNLTVCNNTDSVLVNEELQKVEYCHGFFDNLLAAEGQSTNTNNLFYLNNLSGGLNYFIVIKPLFYDNKNNTTLFFELTERPNFEVLGYPELLLKEESETYKVPPSISYAKYNNNQLIIREGDFPYALERNVYKFNKEKFAFFQSEDYYHVVCNSNASQSVIVSYPTIKYYNILISFTYIFFFLLIQTTILLLIGNRFTHLIYFNFNIKNKVVMAMLLILLVALVFVVGGAIIHTKKQFEKEQIGNLNSKIKSVLIEMEHELSNSDNIHNFNSDDINNILIRFSNVFFTDINLYDLSGTLVGTSRKEIFERNLTGNNINATAYREMVLNKKAKVIHKEFIGNMKYYSAYIPFVNNNNQLIAYLNLPYFSKEVVLRKELLEIIVAVINIFAFILILSIALAIYISNKLTEPLRIVKQRISSIDLSKVNERIDYNGKDEIAELVTEYNRMLEELDKSAIRLAKSERESAWREMAKQIAHEIKNPLTPMKLTIQLLDKSWKNRDADFDKRFNRSTKTIVEQIDSLSSIASAFSQFATMPIARSERVNIIERIKHSTQLFKECEHITINIEMPENKDIYVRADKERMLQVFNNLIKNAIQSIPSGRDGKIKISLALSHKSVVVEIKDNGSGILPEVEGKLFQPNFTTKSSGMGLGLAIVKNIIEELGGAIWHESTLNNGTSFFISLPIFSSSS